MDSKPEKTEKTPKIEKTVSSPDEMRETWFNKFFGLRLPILIHLFVYAAVNGLCYMLNFLIWNGQLWAWHVTAGWGTGLLFHLVTYYLITSGVKSYSKYIFTIHLTEYSIISVYLLLINLVYMWRLPGVLWAHIPIMLWGFGVLLHFVTNSMIEGKGLDAKEIGTIIAKILLLANACYYGLVNATLLYMGLFNNVYRLAYGTIYYWGFGLIAHAAITFIALYLTTTGAKKGFLIHALIYALGNGSQALNITIFREFDLFTTAASQINTLLITAGIWTIVLICHLILAIRYDQTGGDKIDLMKNIFLMHLGAYAAGVVYMYILNIMIWEGRMWWITAALGWAVGVIVNFLLYIFVKEDEKDGLKISVILHIAAYLTIQGLLVWLNLAIWEGRFWVPTVSIGWGVGLAVHILTYFLYKNDMFVPEKGLKISVYYHLTGYAMVNALLVWLNLSIWQGILWFPIVMLAWGIGLGAHGIVWSQLGKEQTIKS